MTKKEVKDEHKLSDRQGNIDAVVVDTPDHWHAIPTVMAFEAGKDVYVEKPASVAIAEGRKMVEAARQNEFSSTTSSSTSGGRASGGSGTTPAA